MTHVLLDIFLKSDNSQVPTLVTVGRHDYVTPLHFAEEIASGIPDSRLEIFEHSGHAPHSDEPQKFNRIILEFLKTRVL